MEIGILLGCMGVICGLCGVLCEYKLGRSVMWPLLSAGWALGLISQVLVNGG